MGADVRILMPVATPSPSDRLTQQLERLSHHTHTHTQMKPPAGYRARIGAFVVLLYHHVAAASRFHAALKVMGVDAAVVDHRYLVSLLHVSTALHRTVTGAVSERTISCRNRAHKNTSSDGSRGDGAPAAVVVERQQPVARAVFVALSLTHNLDRVLQVLPAGSTSTSIAVVLKADAYTDAVQATLEACSGCTADEMVPMPCSSSAELLLLDVFRQHLSATHIKEFYGIQDSDLTAARRQPASADVDRWMALCETESAPARREALIEMKALEMCVVSRLSTCDI